MSELTAVVTRGQSTPHGILGDLLTGKGLACKTVERPWVDNLQGVSAIPTGRYLCKWQWSNKHNKNLYHVLDVPGRDVIEMHSANVFEQLLGCVALGHAVATFTKDSIHPGVPSVDMQGVTQSVTMMDLFHADMRGADGTQQDFWLTIK